MVPSQAEVAQLSAALQTVSAAVTADDAASLACLAPVLLALRAPLALLPGRRDAGSPANAGPHAPGLRGAAGSGGGGVGGVVVPRLPLGSLPSQRYGARAAQPPPGLFNTCEGQ